TLAEADVHKMSRQTKGSTTTRTRRIQKCCLRRTSLSTFIIHPSGWYLPDYRSGGISPRPTVHCLKDSPLIQGLNALRSVGIYRYFISGAPSAFLVTRSSEGVHSLQTKISLNSVRSP